VKTRIMAQMGLRFPQQVARLDRLTRDPISSTIEGRVRSAIIDATRTAAALLLSDYRGGLLTPAVIRTAHDTSGGRVILAADAQGELDKYVGFGVVKCNADEARGYLQRALVTHDDFAAAARDLCAALKLTVGMVITRGVDGITTADGSGAAHIPAPAISDVYDTVGAGDTAIAVLTLALAGGATLPDAAALANYASGLVVRRVGNYTPTLDELRAALDNGQH
jgi:D-glycero-beta-D-manno-heptose-7-phosphate kinase